MLLSVGRCPTGLHPSRPINHAVTPWRSGSPGRYDPPPDRLPSPAPPVLAFHLKEPEMNEKIARFLTERRPATPFLVVDLDVVEENYQALHAAMPDTRIFYAVKANPAPEILK